MTAIPTYPEPPWLATLRTRADAAEAKLAAVAALAHAAPRQAVDVRDAGAGVDAGTAGGCGGGAMSEPSEWTVAIVAETVNGEVVLRMTEPQADELRERLDWLMGDES